MTECGEDDVGPGARDRPLRRGLTLVEVLVTVGIILVLFTLMVVSTRAIQASARQSRAAAQVRLIAEAIEAYAEAWTVWRWQPTGQPVADRAWPHWSAWAQFPAPPYVFPPPSPNCPLVNAPWRNVADDDATNAAGQPIGRQDVEASAACLAYALLTPAMGRTLMPEAEAAFPIKDGCVYPTSDPTTTTPLREVLDSWGAPFRYFWVVRDANSYSGWRMITSADPNDLQSPAAGPPDPFFAVAQGFVLESAGPDGRFGNVWKRGPSQSEIDAAADNVTVRP